MIRSIHLNLQCCEFWQMYTVVEPSSPSAYRTFPLPCKIFLCSSFKFCSLPSPHAPGNHLSDFCSYSFPFLVKSHSMCVWFCIWHLSCSLILLRFIHLYVCMLYVVVCIKSMFLSYCCVVVPCVDAPHVISSPVWWTFRLFSGFSCFEWSCYKHLCAGFCVDTCFHFPWVNT